MFPQLLRARKDSPRFLRRLTFDREERCAEGAAKFQLLSPTLGSVRQQRQLVQPLLKLCCCFGHRRAGNGPMTGLPPIGDGLFDEAGLSVMLREELGLVLHHFGGMAFERLSNLRV